MYNLQNDNDIAFTKAGTCPSNAPSSKNNCALNSNNNAEQDMTGSVYMIVLSRNGMRGGIVLIY